MFAFSLWTNVFLYISSRFQMQLREQCLLLKNSLFSGPWLQFLPSSIDFFLDNIELFDIDKPKTKWSDIDKLGYCAEICFSLLFNNTFSASETHFAGCLAKLVRNDIMIMEHWYASDDEWVISVSLCLTLPNCPLLFSTCTFRGNWFPILCHQVDSAEALLDSTVFPLPCRHRLHHRQQRRQTSAECSCHHSQRINSSLRLKRGQWWRADSDCDDAATLSMTETAFPCCCSTPPPAWGPALAPQAGRRMPNGDATGMHCA